MITKICKKCGKEKDISEYYKRGKYYRTECIPCDKQYQIEYYIKNRQYYLDKSRKWVEDNRERFLKSLRERYKNNKEGYAEYSKQHKRHIDEYNKEYYKKNKESITQERHLYKPKRNENRKQRYKTDIKYMIESTLRRRLLCALKNNFKKGSAIEMLGCSIHDFKNYIESQFTDGMSWDNYGLHGWHLDHRIPCASFDLTDIVQQRQCFHNSNLQPLWAEDNLSKGAKF